MITPCWKAWAVQCRSKRSAPWHLALYKDGSFAVFRSRGAAWTFSRELRNHLLTRTISVHIEKF